MWHDCKDLKNFPKDHMTQEENNNLPTCTCSILGLFFRNSYKMCETEGAIGQLMQTNFYSNHHFKREFGKSFMQYSYFMFDIRNNGLGSKMLGDVSFQALPGEFMTKAITSCEHFPLFLDAVYDFLNYFYVHHK